MVVVVAVEAADPSVQVSEVAEGIADAVVVLEPAVAVAESVSGA